MSITNVNVEMGSELLINTSTILVRKSRSTTYTNNFSVRKQLFERRFHNTLIMILPFDGVHHGGFQRWGSSVISHVNTLNIITIDGKRKLVDRVGSVVINIHVPSVKTKHNLVFTEKGENKDTRRMTKPSDVRIIHEGAKLTELIVNL